MEMKSGVGEESALLSSLVWPLALNKVNQSLPRSLAFASPYIRRIVGGQQSTCMRTLQENDVTLDSQSCFRVSHACSSKRLKKL